MKLNDVYKANDLLLRLRQAETWLSNTRGLTTRLTCYQMSIEVPADFVTDIIRKQIATIKEELRALGVEVP